MPGYNETLLRAQTLTQILRDLKWTEYLDFSFMHVMLSEVALNLGKIKGKFDRPYLKKLHAYTEAVFLRWLTQLNPLYSEWAPQLEQQVLIQFVKVRTSEMFSLFQDFPDSLPAINDFKSALERTKLHSYFTTQVKEQFQARLLLPGVITLLIIEHYIQAIRVLKLIDPSTILLEIISEPIKEHLRNRQDTLRCIVTSILADEGELYEQLGQAYVRIPLRG